MGTSIRLDHVTLGVCYYPEHWDASIWESDLTRMQELGIETVRVFEFAWNIAEPTEGVYDFTLFDDFLALAEKKGMQVIMCTPTATPPAWLTHAHPEVLNATMDGTLIHHGHRRHYNYNSPVYREYASKIVTALARHYGSHPAIIGWQLDNEFNCECNEFYSEADRKAFRDYLKEKFGTLDALNEAIGARFWNQTYTAWDEVDMTRPTIHNHSNPHMELLEKRFFSRSAVSFAAMQAKILRQYIGERFITTNGLFGHLDNFSLVEKALDFICYDSYPNFAYGHDGVNSVRASEDMGDRAWSLQLSNTRAVSPNFGVMEQQSGANGWDFRMMSPMPKPGQMRLWSLQSIAHGADYVSYFRWRTAPYGTEIYWHGLLDYDSRPNRRTDELMQVYHDVRKLTDLAGSRYEARVALVNDYLNAWDGERDAWHGPLDEASRSSIFAACQYSHTPVDMLYIRHTDDHNTTLEELLPYKVLFYPHATILTKDTAELLEAYCRAGGILVMGARTGYKDEFGRCPMMPMPGFARSLCGAEVEDYTFVRKEEPTPTVSWNGKCYEAPVFHDILGSVDGGEVLGVFCGGYYDGKPALIRKNYENGGAAYYLGAGFSEEMTRALLEVCRVASPYAERFALPEEVELACREKDGVRTFFLLNYTATEQTVRLHMPQQELFSGTMRQGFVTLPPYGVVALR